MSLLSTRRRLAARTLAQQAGRCACCEDAPPSIPLGAFLLAATELPQVALARLEQRGDVHLALGRRRHRRPRDQLSARGVRLTDTLRDPPMFPAPTPVHRRRYGSLRFSHPCERKQITSDGSPDHESISGRGETGLAARRKKFWAQCLPRPNSCNRGALVCACLL